ARRAMAGAGVQCGEGRFSVERGGCRRVPMSVVGMLMVLLVVSSAIRQRRRALALIALQGATPGQLTSRVCAQVLLLEVAATLVSLIVSPALARGLYPFATRQLEANGLPCLPQAGTGMLRAGRCRIVLGFAMALVGPPLTVLVVGGIAPVDG
ncbi:UNVERIFIED_CONTAM: ABC transporter permease, partial [Bifidobacterium longum subsp. infantis]|nr:ABC transporter permease [Bifidobacterium longum subsp. infantis]